MLNEEDGELSSPIPDFSNSRSLSRLSIITKLARIIPRLRRTFNNTLATPTNIQNVEDDLNRCTIFLPPQHQLSAEDRLDPNEIGPLLILQDLRLLLHRHSLSPSSSKESRISSINKCLEIARDTARIISRIGYQPQVPNQNSELQSFVDKEPQWDDLSWTANAFTCMHIWRCTLFLIACNDFGAALLCAKANATIGRARIINQACGSYTDFFLQHWTGERRKNKVLEEDEETIAYLSADLQGNLDVAWIWQEENDTDASDGVFTKRGELDNNRGIQWTGWNQLLDNLQLRLQEYQPTSQPQNSSDSMIKLDTTTVSNPGQQLSPSNRMSIADLI
jgi:hypothetical protein